MWVVVKVEVVIAPPSERGCYLVVKPGCVLLRFFAVLPRNRLGSSPCRQLSAEITRAIIRLDQEGSPSTLSPSSVPPWRMLSARYWMQRKYSGASELFRQARATLTTESTCRKPPAAS